MLFFGVCFFLYFIKLSAGKWFFEKDTVITKAPNKNMNTKSAVRPRNEPSSNILQ